MKLISRKEAVDRGLKFYFTGKPCVRGHISNRYTAKSYCLECSRESAIESQKRNKQRKRDNQATYAKKNRDKIISRYHNNKEEYSDRSRRYYQDNKEDIIERVKKYAQENRDAIRDRGKKYYRKNKNTVKFRVKAAASNSIRGVVSAIRKVDPSKAPKYSSKIDFDVKEFKDHIESLFQDGMTWNNYGDWHVDHIRPIISFINDDVFDLSEINNISNLQPLWAVDNLSKGGKYID